MGRSLCKSARCWMHTVQRWQAQLAVQAQAQGVDLRSSQQPRPALRRPPLLLATAAASRPRAREVWRRASWAAAAVRAPAVVAGLPARCWHQDGPGATFTVCSRQGNPMQSMCSNSVALPHSPLTFCCCREVRSRSPLSCDPLSVFVHRACAAPTAYSALPNSRISIQFILCCVFDAPSKPLRLSSAATSQHHIRPVFLPRCMTLSAAVCTRQLTQWQRWAAQHTGCVRSPTLPAPVNVPQLSSGPYTLTITYQDVDS